LCGNLQWYIPPLSDLGELPVIEIVGVEGVKLKPPSEGMPRYGDPDADEEVS
jgi:hypothetical protein